MFPCFILFNIKIHIDALDLYQVQIVSLEKSVNKLEASPEIIRYVSNALFRANKIFISFDCFGLSINSFLPDFSLNKSVYSFDSEANQYSFLTEIA
jgi:hypothetical protein